jgi:putative DNA primase/helicase
MTDKTLHDRIHGPAARQKAAEAAANPEAVIIELAKMRPLQQAKALREKAKLLGVPIEALKAEVKRHKPKDESERDFLPHWNVEPRPEPVDGDALLDELRNHFKRYGVVPEEADVALPLWVLHTWVFQCFDITPYLAITSPTPRCGKTVLMMLLYWLCCRAKKSDSMSRAALYRSVDADKPTLILDEVNWIGGLDDERANIINGGFERNGHAETCEGEGAAIKPRLWSTFCPKAFGLIGRLTPTLMDRSIEIAMRRKTRAEIVERLRRGDNNEHAEFRQKCRRWAEDNIDALKAAPEMVAADLNDRAVDCWEPLLIVAKQAGGEWLGRALYAAKVLSAGDSASEQNKGVKLLRHISEVFDGTDWPAVITKTMIAKLCEDDEKPWATWNSGKPISAKQIGALLSPFKITSDTVHPNETGEAKAKGYRRVRFAEAFERYLRAGEAQGRGGRSVLACKCRWDGHK